MVKRIGGSRRKTRHRFKKDKRKKGKISVTSYIQKFSEGDKVKLDVEPAVQKSLYSKRFIGKCGEVVDKQGKCYKIKINDQGKEKFVIVHPVHLRRLQ